MAHIVEQKLVISLSKLYKSSDSSQEDVIPEGFVESLEAIIGELVTDPSIIVEVSETD